jgi:DNA polymerase elongation subunit (family B)
MSNQIERNVTQGEIRKIKIPKQKSRVKSFRLIDFKVFDQSPVAKGSQSGDCSDGSEGGSKFRPDDSNFIIQMFGVNEVGETCSIFVNDYKPFFFVKVDDFWTMREANMLLMHMRKYVGKFSEQSVLSVQIVEKQKLYGFSGGRKYKFVQLNFQNVRTMNKAKGMWYEYVNNERKMKKNVMFPSQNGSTLELYESNIPPLLRYFHINNISPSGWVYIVVNKAVEPVTRTTNCTYEYICGLSQIKPISEKETQVPYKICSFDIEASSSHGDFPLPKKTYKRFVANMIDAFDKQTSITTLTNDRARVLFQKIVMTAFGYDTFSEIDVVYPKIMPTKETVKRLTEDILNTSIPNIKPVNNESDIRELLEINTIFEGIRNMREGSGNGDGDDSDNENNDGTQEVSGLHYSRYKKMKNVKIQKNTTVIDVLLSDSYTRDEKIDVVDKVFVKTYPQLEGDKVTMIGSTFIRYGEQEPYLNHCVVLDTCDPVPGAVIESAYTETELLLKWVEIIQTENPDIIIGFNIFGFDYEFMFRRAEELHCEQEFLKLSRSMGEICASSEMLNGQPTGKYKLDSTKITLASGDYDLRYPSITGRLQIDLFAYFKRDFNLPHYSLDYIAGQNINDAIKKAVITEHPTWGNVTELYTQNITGLHINDFIHIEEVGYTSDYYAEGKKFEVVDIVNKDGYNVLIIRGHEQLAMKLKTNWCIAKDDVTPKDIFRLQQESSAGRAIVAKYCIQDCNLVHHLFKKVDVITGYVEMSRICSVPISFLVFRGQGIKLTSYVAKKCREKDTLMPDLEKKSESEGYEGAIVLPPKCSMYMDNPVACVDYASLYPSSMISQNYSHDSKVWAKEFDLNGELIYESGEKDEAGNYIYDNLPGYQYIDIEFDTYRYLKKTPTSSAVKTLYGKMKCRWAQFPDNKKGIMPSILQELLKARSDTRKVQKSESDPFMKNILEKRQLGYKVTANSLYGQCGSRTSTFYEKDVAASTTATGRMMITYARRIIEEVYGDRVYHTKDYGPVVTKAEYVYGDTDSVFFTFNLQHPETGEKIRGKDALAITIEIAQDAAKLCTKWLKPPMELAYEKTLMPFILLSKKRYVGMLYEDDPNKGKLKFMGLSLKRRDSCDYLKDTYGGILDILIKERNVEKAIHFLENSLNTLIDGNVSMDKLTITKALRSGYANPKQIAHKVLADRIGQRDPGNKPKPGDRMKFVHFVNDTKGALQGDKIETPDYIIDMRLKIDYTFYVTNQLMKPLQQLFGLALVNIWETQGKTAAIKTYYKDIEKLQREYPNMETYMKKREKYCSTKVKALLFDKILTKVFNEKHKLQTVSSFFQPLNKK